MAFPRVVAMYSNMMNIGVFYTQLNPRPTQPPGVNPEIALYRHCTLYTVHCQLPSEHCSVLIANCTLHAKQGKLYTEHSTLHTAQCTLHTAQCTLQTTHCKLLDILWDGTV